MLPCLFSDTFYIDKRVTIFLKIMFYIDKRVTIFFRIMFYIDKRVTIFFRNTFYIDKRVTLPFYFVAAIAFISLKLIYVKLKLLLGEICMRPFFYELI